MSNPAIGSSGVNMLRFPRRKPGIGQWIAGAAALAMVAVVVMVAIASWAWIVQARNIESLIVALLVAGFNLYLLRIVFEIVRRP